MKTVRRLLYRDIVGAVFFVSLAFLSLFFFIDFIDELDNVGRIEAGAFKAALLALLDIPGHFYQLFPIAVLIGSIYSLAAMAHTSQFTILRTGGLGPGRALGLLTYLAAAFAALTFFVGDFAVPYFDLQADTMRARFLGASTQGRRGAWLKDHQTLEGRERRFSINVGQADASGRLQTVRIFEFDNTGGLISRLAAKQAVVDAKGYWRLTDVTQTEWLAPKQGDSSNASASTALDARLVVRETKLNELNWQSSLHAGVIAAAVLPASSMSTIELYRYTQHLSAQEQSAQVHKIQFWRKAIYPFACFVMVALALPFAYLHGRAGGISLKVFGGIMLGISFVLLNNVAGHVGILQNWVPWIVATGPSLFYLALSLAAFGWLVRYR